MNTTNSVLIVNTYFYTSIIFDRKSAEVLQTKFSAGFSRYIYIIGRVAEEFFNFGQTSYQVTQGQPYSFQVYDDSSMDKWRSGCNFLRAAILTVVSGSLIFWIMLVAKVLFHRQAIAFVHSINNVNVSKVAERIPDEFTKVNDEFLTRQGSSIFRCIDKLGENEVWIPHQLLEQANNKNVYLFEVSYNEVTYLFFSKNKYLREIDFSANLKKILEKNSLIKQRIAMCYYASAYLHLEVQNSHVISMGTKPYDNENSLISHGMSHHQLLYKSSEEFIIIDPTWPRFTFYQSVVLLATTQEDCDEMYELAFGRDYRITEPFSREKEQLCSFLRISLS